MQGCVFSIEEFSVYDGPGIRTTVFLKGCPLRCTWCHNPEGQNSAIEIVKSPNGCIGCNHCFEYACEENGRLYFTEKSIKNCPMGLLRFCGELYESEVLCQKLLKNKNILNNGGGVTFSGGEPLMQYEFVFECVGKLKDKLHTAIQTSGYCDEEIFKQAVSLADFFLFDLKIIDDSLHKKYVGASNKRILNNFSYLAKSGKKFVVRTPLIPTITDTEKNITDICELLAKNNVDYVELLPYNKMAGGKYKMVNREYEPQFDETANVSIREEIFNNYDIKFKIF